MGEGTEKKEEDDKEIVYDVPSGYGVLVKKNDREDEEFKSSKSKKGSKKKVSKKTKQEYGQNSIDGVDRYPPPPTPYFTEISIRNLGKMRRCYIGVAINPFY